MRVYYKIGVIASIVLGFISLGSVLAQEQLDLRDRADRFYKEYRYANAVPVYLKLVDNKNPRLNDLERLAESYRRINDYANAEHWYARVVQNGKASPENFIHYAEVLKQNSKYAEAKKALQAYANKSGNNSIVASEIAGCDSAVVWMANPTSHTLKNEDGINTEYAEFSAFPVNGKVYYTGEPYLSLEKNKYGWTGNSYLRVYTANDQGGSLGNPSVSTAFFNEENYHVGPVSSDPSGKTLYITRTYPGKQVEIEKDGNRKYKVNKLELYIYTEDVNGNWNGVPFAYNNVKEYSVGHAALSPDGNVLYFVSDMPGGLGGTDIWFCERQSNGNWGSPQNAGARINTAKDELFLSVSADGTLYYSSNGFPGMGGLDIFSSVGSKKNWNTAVNLRYPINSPGDDFAYINTINTDEAMTGYLSSNRQGGKGDDDIYSFTYQMPKVVLILKGMTYNKDTRAILPDASVTLFGEGRTFVAKKASSYDGSFFFELDKEIDYKVLGTKTGFMGDSTFVSTKGILKSDTLFASLYLDPILVVGKTFKLENIYYDFDKDNIRKDAAQILDGLLSILRDNPTLRIELASHTDSRGSDSYNMALSQRRAQSAVNYLIGHGIDRERMVAKGYGESHILNGCANGVQCSEKEHQVNRRTEFTVLEY